MSKYTSKRKAEKTKAAGANVDACMQKKALQLALKQNQLFVAWDVAVRHDYINP